MRSDYNVFLHDRGPEPICIIVTCVAYSSRKVLALGYAQCVSGNKFTEKNLKMGGNMHFQEGVAETDIFRKQI